jgi:rhodanese-related sulfurtransferase
MVENVPPRQAWEALRSDPAAQLCDVRTDAEWTYVGISDLSAAGKHPVLVPWQFYPTMEVNGDFLNHLRAAGLTPDHAIYFICRSGVRSRAAAEAAEAGGYRTVYNVADGFEGPLDGAGHRGASAGWKAEGLPWRQR